jgi:N,N-dimethylformamidase
VDVVGYSDPLSVPLGDPVRIMVSCRAPRFRVDVVRLVHGDRNPAGPGLRVEEVPTSRDGVYEGVEQPLPRGSFVRVGGSGDHDSFTAHAWIWPTAPGAGLQGVLTKRAGDGRGFALVVEDGGLALWLGPARLRTGVPLEPRSWYCAVGAYDAAERTLSLHQIPLWAGAPVHVRSEAPPGADARAPGEPLLMGALPGPRAHFNGKLEAPAVAARALSDAEARSLAAGSVPPDWPAVVAGQWDFSAGIPSAHVQDVSGHGRHGETVNNPARGVTGRTWTGADLDFRRVPEQYAAIHLHDDDLDDARWRPAFELDTAELPRSGVYAARLRTEAFEDFVPFFVTARPGASAHRVALVLPTFCYLAYANEHIQRGESYLDGATPYEAALYSYILDNRLHSTYDAHSDGSGVTSSSWRRPIANMRPCCNQPTTGFAIPHNLGADLCLVDWLEHHGLEYDLLTDHVLHEHGADCLAPYRVVLTGTHPEYVSERMLDGLES